MRWSGYLLGAGQLVLYNSNHQRDIEVVLVCIMTIVSGIQRCVLLFHTVCKRTRRMRLGASHHQILCHYSQIPSSSRYGSR